MMYHAVNHDTTRRHTRYRPHLDQNAPRGWKDHAEGHMAAAHGDVEMKAPAPPAKPDERSPLLENVRLAISDSMSTDLFGVLASVLRRNVKSLTSTSDPEWDKMLRYKELQIASFSFCGVLASVGISIVTWYGAGRVTKALSELDASNRALLLIFQFICTFSTIITGVLIVQRYVLLAEEKKHLWSGVSMYNLITSGNNAAIRNKFETSYDLRKSPGTLMQMAVELGVHALHPFIWLNTPATKSYYDALQILIFLRLYLFTRVVFQFSESYIQRNEIVSSNVDLQRMGFQITLGATLILIFYAFPVRITGFSMLLVLVVMGFIVFISERSYVKSDGSLNVFTDLPSCFWFAFVTFSTAGYGDMVPGTLFGKASAVTIGVFGIAITTVFGGIVTNRMSQSREQRYVSEYLTMRQSREELLHSAAWCIQSTFRWYKNRVRDTVTPWRPTGHKANRVYAAIKKFREDRWSVSQALSTANDPVIESKMNRTSRNLRSSLHKLSVHQKTFSATSKNIESHIAEIVKLLDPREQRTRLIQRSLENRQALSMSLTSL